MREHERVLPLGTQQLRSSVDHAPCMQGPMNAARAGQGEWVRELAALPTPVI